MIHTFANMRCPDKKEKRPSEKFKRPPDLVKDLGFYLVITTFFVTLMLLLLTTTV